MNNTVTSNNTKKSKPNIKEEEMGTWKVRLKRFLNPRRGRRRRRGVWPPSNPNFIVPRAFWPLCPLPAVFPFPDPIPRPFLVFCFLAPLLSLKSFNLRRLTVVEADPIAAIWVKGEVEMEALEKEGRRARVLGKGRRGLMIGGWRRIGSLAERRESRRHIALQVLAWVQALFLDVFLVRFGSVRPWSVQLNRFN